MEQVLEAPKVEIKDDPESAAAFQALIQQRKEENAKVGHVGEILNTGKGNVPVSVANSFGKNIEKDLELGLYDDIPEKEREEALSVARKNLEKWDTWNEETNLEKDVMTIPGQCYTVVCWIGPSFKAKSHLYGYRIMGAFPDIPSAQEYSRKVNKFEPMYDCGIVEMNLWCYNYPDVADTVDENGNLLSPEEYQAKYDAALNKFIVDHKVEREESKQLFEARKRVLARNKSKKESDIPEDLKEELEKTKFTGRPTDKLKEIHTRETKKWSDKPALNSTHDRLREVIRRREEISEEIKQQDEGVELDLTPSSLKIHGQEYAAVSYVGHTGTNLRIPLCVKGVYESKEACEEAIKKLVQMDNTFDILPAPLYCWLPCDPDIDQVKQVYTNERLNELTEGTQNEAQEALRFHSVVKTHQEEVLNQPFNPNFKGQGVEPHVPVFDSGTETATNVFKGTEDSNIPTFSFQGHAGGAADELKDVWEGNVDVNEGLSEVSKKIEAAKAKANEDYKETKQFEGLESGVQELEVRLQELLKEGHSEEDAREMLRDIGGKTAVKYSTPDEEDLIKVEKPKVEYKTIGELMAEQQEIIKKMKAENATPKEIREYLSAHPVQ